MHFLRTRLLRDVFSNSMTLFMMKLPRCYNVISDCALTYLENIPRNIPGLDDCSENGEG